MSANKLPVKHRLTPQEYGKLGGRPRTEVAITPKLKAYLVKHPDYLDRIVRAWLDMVLKRGNLLALQEILNRLEGRVTERHELEAKIPVTLVFQPVQARLEPGGAEVVEGEVKVLDVAKIDAD